MTDPGVFSLWDRITERAQTAAGNLRVKSALNPMLWLCAIVTVPAWVMAAVTYCFGQAQLGDILLGLGSLPVIATIVGFLYLMVKYPEKLQSEEYQIRHEALELIKQKGSHLELAPTSIASITNPALPRLGPGGAE